MARKTRFLHIVVLAVAIWVGFFFRLGVIPLLNPDEARYTDASRTMERTGDWVVPQWNGEPRLQKPILFYWLQAAFLSVVPDEELAARFPSALGATWIVFLLYGYASRRWGNSQGLAIALSFIAFPLTLILSRLAITDMTLAACVTAAILFSLSAYREKRSGFLVTGYAFLGAALLTKGPVALLFVIPAIVPILFSGRMRKRLSWRIHVLGLGVMLGVLLPWLILVSWREPGIWNYWFFNETVSRVLTNAKHRDKGIWFYIPVVFISTFPACLALLIPSLWIKAWRAFRKGWLSVESQSFFLWAAVPFIFFSLSHSQMWTYWLPAMPAFALFVVPALYQRRKHLFTRFAALPVGVSITVAVMLTSVFIIVLSPLANWYGWHKSAAPFVQASGLNQLPESVMLMECEYNMQPALLFYADRKVVSGDREAIKKALQSEQPVIVACSQSVWDALSSINSFHLIYHKERWCVIGNQAAMATFNSL